MNSSTKKTRTLPITGLRLLGALEVWNSSGQKSNFFVNPNFHLNVENKGKGSRDKLTK